MQQRIDAAAQARAVFAAVARLPDSERAVLVLVALDDLSVTEAATVLGLRPVTAPVRLHRARCAAPPDRQRRVTRHLSATGGIMTHTQFEDRLLSELRQLVAARPPPG